MSDSGNESILAITGKSCGAVPIFGKPETAMPLFCSVFVNSVAAHYFLGEELGVQKLVGIGVIVIGVCIVVRS
jgi:uncharacterized membrane protein